MINVLGFVLCYVLCFVGILRSWDWDVKVGSLCFFVFVLVLILFVIGICLWFESFVDGFYWKISLC